MTGSPFVRTPRKSILWKHILYDLESFPRCQHMCHLKWTFYRQQFFFMGEWWVSQEVISTPGQPPDIGYIGIQPTGGRYASYWNTFLFKIINIMLLFKNSMCVSSSSILHSDMFKFKTRKPDGFMQS